MKARHTPLPAFVLALAIGVTTGCSTEQPDAAGSSRTATSRPVGVAVSTGPPERLTIDTWPSSVELDDSTGEVYVLASNEILVFEQQSNAPMHRIRVDPGADDIAFDRVNRTAWVSGNSRSNAPEDRTVNIVDTQTKQVIGSVEVEFPAIAVGVDALAHRAFVVNRPDDQTKVPDSRAWLTVFDTRTREEITTIELPFAAYDIDVDPNTHSVLIAGWGNAAFVSAQTLALDRSRSVGSASSSLETVVDSERGRAFVVSDGVMWTISTGTSASVTEREIEWEDGSMAIGPGGTLLVADYENRGLLVIDPETGSILRRVPVDVAPNSIATTSDRRTVYVSSNPDKALSVIRFE